MNPTKNDLSEKTRAAVGELLNGRLADLIDLQLQTKQAHWNVKGPSFIALHELFDKVSEDVEDLVDDVAERVVALGGTAEGTLAAVAKHTQLPPYPLQLTAGRDHVEALSNALATVGKAIRAAIDRANELGDADTADLFTGASRELDKNLWFVEAHLQGER
ncbi:MAG TPA: DNA starvation/stationary phase protection protein Dps [Pirellulales bacterium]|jgi:starvation-inducible DNA-binding protein|nr:DNA starvation/stationary phase protection protein Dps [Pirellulales bacterium]